MAVLRRDRMRRNPTTVPPYHPILLRSISYRHSIAVLMPMLSGSVAAILLLLSSACCEVAIHAMTVPTSARAAVAQLRSTSDKINNLLDVARCAGMASRQQASMLFIPECFGFLGEGGQQTLDNAEPPIKIEASGVASERGPLFNVLASTVSTYAKVDCNQETSKSSVSESTLNALRDGGQPVSLLEGLRTIARESGCWISAGGMHESGAPPAPALEATTDGEDKPRVYNSHVIIDNEGAVRAVYRKSHLFDVAIPGKVNLRESATTAPGDAVVVCDSPIGRLGLSICYDVRFPEHYVDMVQRGGAEILLVPSAFTIPTGRAHWHTLLKSRAIENQCYVLAAAQVGKHNEKRKSYGHALAIDPWGEVLADAGGYDGIGTSGVKIDDESTGTNVQNGGENEAEAPVKVPSIILCDVDSKKIRSIRERMPVQQHRRDAPIKFGL